MTRKFLLTIPLFFVTGCVNVASGAICDATDKTRTLHAAALAEDGGNRSVVTGQTLIAQIDAACAN